ncbi:efflux RND transporter permease subunit [Salidesulfovibrio onnuriiensis]|uniref:efflux RND transporter permease subunit n=1 Tax=Salidesulfovibrio onnuriiensis TaxID=2583823 RepID=UPI0011C90A36|nr:efflux RND transporter permease subunit [Salidesulfovibrio onnuriiensis]
MNIGELSIRKKTITLVLTVLLVAGGIQAFFGLGRLEDPEFTIKDALVVTPYAGATPMEVTEEVTDPLETAIQSLPQLDEVKSLSRAGMSVITVTIKNNYDKSSLPQVWDELRRKVNDTKPALPDGCVPTVVDDFGDVYGILLSVTGDGYSYKDLEDFCDFMRKELLLVDNVAKVVVWGVQQQVVYVEISRAKMAQLGIGLDTIYAALRSQNMVVPAGSVKVGPEYVRIDPTGAYTSVDDIRALQIHDPVSGNLITLSDIAEVKRGYQTPPEKLMRHNGKTALGIGVSIVSGGNVVDLGRAVKSKLAELESRMPVGIEMEAVNFQSDDVSVAIDGFVISFIEAIAIVIVVLLIFMGMRSGLLIGAVLAITVLGTFLFMKMYAIDLQRISLGALIIALGMLVDNAIVVTEGMLVRINAGKDGVQSAREVVSQNMLPLLGATVIAVLAFAGIGLSDDATGEYCGSLFSVMLISLMLSWVIAITVTPLFCHMFFKPGEKNAGGEEERDPYRGTLFVAYRTFLKLCIDHRWATVAAMVGLLALSIYGFSLIKGSFFPDSTKPQFYIHYWLPEGADIRKTSEDIGVIEGHLLADERVDFVSTFIGEAAPRYMLTFAPDTSGSKAYGLLIVNMKDFKFIDPYIAEIQKYLTENFPDAEPKLKKLQIGPGSESAIEVRFLGPDPEILRDLALRARTIMENHPATVSARDNWRQRAKVIRPLLAHDRAMQAGVTRPVLNEALATNFTGVNVGLYREGDKMLPIISRMPEKDRMDVYSIRDVQVWSPTTRKVIPVSQVLAGFDTVWEDPVMRRQNRKLCITASCDPQFGTLASEVLADIMPAINAIELPSGYEMEWGGEYEESSDAQAGIRSSMMGTVVLMIVIVIMLFNNLRQPLIIWLTVPLAVIGVSCSLLLTGLPFGFMALLGFLSLTGMLIKNSIVLLDQINLDLEEGKEPMTAVLDASVSRMRPVCMAAITTVLGMIPLIPDVFFVGMAVTIMGGLSFATVLTLVVVPVLYTIFYKVK